MGYLVGYPWLEARSPKPTQSRGIESQPSEHLPKETIENTQIEAVSEGVLDQGHQAKRHKVLIRDIQQESLKETPSNPSDVKSKKRL
jgi:hypothetical protein